MDKSIPLHLQEIIFSSSNTTLSRKISGLEKEGRLKKIAPRIYTSNLNEDPADIIRRNIFKIVGHQYPGILLSHRSAFEYKPTSTSDLFFTSTYSRKVELPGVTLNIMAGWGAIEGDNPFIEGLYVSRKERAFLENMQESRKPGPSSKTLSIPELEEKLEQIVRVKGENGLNNLRDACKALAGKTGMEKEFTRLNKLISAILSTKPSSLLSSQVAIARAFGQPFDPARIVLFETLFIELQQREFPDIPEQNFSTRSFRNFAFFEAYFSNFIEGTKFEISEAKQIIETEMPMTARNEDSHDILGTYRIVSSKEEMSRTPSTAGELLDILRYRHKILLAAREEKMPGEFKNRNNQAGNTSFVDYQLVRGTLIKGFDFYQAIRDPFARAAYMMFMISEVHPFMDGNGRMARVMMNAELVKAEQTKIIIPTVFREDYLGALRQLTKQSKTDTYIRMLQQAQQFSALIVGEDMDPMQEILVQANAFEDGDDYILKI